jgi:hypothetical protein
MMKRHRYRRTSGTPRDQTQKSTGGHFVLHEVKI